ncbi:MAG: hypothetical protein ACREOZ_04790, partial [Gloeomargaritales cyanobacterium]
LEGRINIERNGVPVELLGAGHHDEGRPSRFTLRGQREPNLPREKMKQSIISQNLRRPLPDEWRAR